MTEQGRGRCTCGGSGVTSLDPLDHESDCPKGYIPGHATLEPPPEAQPGAAPFVPFSSKRRTLTEERVRPPVPRQHVCLDVGADVRVRVKTSFGEVVIDTAPDRESPRPRLLIRARGSMFRRVVTDTGTLGDGHEHFDAEVRFDA